MATSPLISAHELADLAEEVTILDVRWRLGGPPGLPEYRRGHIPGATYVDLATELADPPGSRGRHPLPETTRFEQSMRRHGVRRNRPVVAYDDAGGSAAARCWWLLRYHGHLDVRVLDGGWQAWLAEERPVAKGDATADPGDFTARPGALPVLDADRAAQLARDGVLLDARAGERFRGEHEPVDPVAGHIPGAKNVPFEENLVGPGGRFKDARELAAVYDRVGALRGQGVGVYCGSGVSAAHDVLALASLGVEAALYPGSWSEWVFRGDRPVATGK